MQRARPKHKFNAAHSCGSTKSDFSLNVLLSYSKRCARKEGKKLMDVKIPAVIIRNTSLQFLFTHKLRLRQFRELDTDHSFFSAVSSMVFQFESTTFHIMKLLTFAKSPLLKYLRSLSKIRNTVSLKAWSHFFPWKFRRAILLFLDALEGSFKYYGIIWS